MKIRWVRNRHYNTAVIWGGRGNQERETSLRAAMGVLEEAATLAYDRHESIIPRGHLHREGRGVFAVCDLAHP